MKSICIIPARGGSKRIPRKNIKDFLGKPIIAYSIEAAINSKLFDEVMVSTDDSEIAEAAIKFGATVPFLRSAKNSDDFATTADVILEVLEFYKKDEIHFDVLCCLYPTAPFVDSEKLKRGFLKLTERNSNIDSVISIVKFSFPPQRGLTVSIDHRLEFQYPENRDLRSQDLVPVYHDAGQFYWSKCEVFAQTHSLFNHNSSFVEFSELEVQDIDNLTDWKLAELKYTLNKRS